LVAAVFAIRLLRFFPIAGAPASSTPVTGISGQKIQIQIVVKETYWNFRQLAPVLLELGHKSRIRQ
jgi:hypothetical protein